MSGERTLLTKLLTYKGTPHETTRVPTGDDGCVFLSGGILHCICTDSFAEGVHFSKEYFSGTQIGEKIFEATISDIAAMGGKPQRVFLSISLPENTSEVYLCEIYEGVEARACAHGVEISGGETIALHSQAPLFTVTAHGTILDELSVCTRDGARPGDKIYVTGTLGGSAAGLKALSSKMAGLQTIKDKHLHPRARTDIVDRIAPLASAMIDISDGLSSEIFHICNASGCGAQINAGAVPLEPETNELAELTGVDPLNFALGGGEDFELLFTTSKEVPSDIATCIGEILPASEMVILKNGEPHPLKLSGYDHFHT